MARLPPTEHYEYSVLWSTVYWTLRVQCTVEYSVLKTTSTVWSKKSYFSCKKAVTHSCEHWACLGDGVEVLTAGRGSGWCSKEGGAQNLQGVYTKGELKAFRESIQKVSSKPSGSLYKRRARLLQGVYSKGALNPFRESIQKVSSKPSGSLYKRWGESIQNVSSKPSGSPYKRWAQNLQVVYTKG